MSAIPEEVKGRGLVEATWMRDGEPRSVSTMVDALDPRRAERRPSVESDRHAVRAVRVVPRLS